MNHARRAFRIAWLTPSGLLLLLLWLYALNAIEASHEGRYAVGWLIMLYFFLAAPLLHLIGFISGVIGWRQQQKGSGKAMLLNVAIPMAGTFLWIVMLVLPKAMVVR